MRTIKTCAQRVFAVWVSLEDRIVSFHMVEGYERMEFPSRDRFLREILVMSSTGYRFQ